MDKVLHRQSEVLCLYGSQQCCQKENATYENYRNHTIKYEYLEQTQDRCKWKELCKSVREC